MIESANPDVETLKVLVGLLITIVVFVIGILRYFAIKRDKEIDESIKDASNNLARSNDLLSQAVQQLREVVNSLRLQYEIRQPIVDERLKVHGQEIEELNDELQEIKAELIQKINDVHNEVTNLKTEHKMFHCNYKAEENGKKSY